VTQTTVPLAGGLFAIEQHDDTLLVVPVRDLRELECQWIEAGARDVLELLNGSAVRKVILDFHRTDTFGSTALSFFLRLWKAVTGRHGRLAFCNVSAHETEILRVTRLDRLWPVCLSRDEAVAAVSE
jgi:anti-anti-sigma factor